MLSPEILERIAVVSDEMIAFRRELHQYPETGFEEKETTDRIVTRLGQYGLVAERFQDITGCKVRVGHGEGKAVYLRADIDALPLQDIKSCEYHSKVKGKMHACGHDVHTSIVLGAMTVLSKVDSLKRPIIGLFQPAEELGQGAKAVLEKVGIEDAERIVGLHVEPTLPVGTVAIKPGPVCACVIEFEIEFKGKSAHGARPHLGADAVYSACEFVNQCYSLINRRIDAREPNVITIGAIHGGMKSNIVSESCQLKATIRAFSTDVARKVLGEVRRVAEGICLMHETHHELRVTIDLPAVVSDKDAARSVATAAKEVLGGEQVIEDFPTSLGGEDFGVYLENIKGAMFRLGVMGAGKEAPQLHSQMFDIDEKAIQVGIKVMVASALQMMNE